jgi:hypothetical protein
MPPTAWRGSPGFDTIGDLRIWVRPTALGEVISSRPIGNPALTRLSMVVQPKTPGSFAGADTGSLPAAAKARAGRWRQARPDLG